MDVCDANPGTDGRTPLLAEAAGTCSGIGLFPTVARLANDQGLLEGDGDVLKLTELPSSIRAPHDEGAFGNGWLRFDTSCNVNTIVKIDLGGGGNSYVDLVTLSNVMLVQSDHLAYSL